MKIATERVGDSVLMTIENSRHAVTVLLPVDVAAELGGNLLMQSAFRGDGLVRLTVGGPGPPRPELLAPVRDDRTQHARRARARKKP